MVSDSRIKTLLNSPHQITVCEVDELIKEVAKYRGIEKSFTLYEERPGLEEIKSKITDWRKDCADLMDIEEFLECVECGGFIDDDGSGDYIDDEAIEIRGVHCNPSDVNDAIAAGIHYVLWYNK